MWSRPESDEALLKRMLPTLNGDRADRARAWSEWQASRGERAVMKFIRFKNTSLVPDEDILQEALLTAYMEVERGRYEPREGIPFTAYVKGIARNKIREARRRERPALRLDDLLVSPGTLDPRQLEEALERHEAYETLRRGLAGLPASRRTVIECFIQGESTGEIAGQLAMSEALVRQHKCRGLRSLRQSWMAG